MQTHNRPTRNPQTSQAPPSPLASEMSHKLEQVDKTRPEASGHRRGKCCQVEHQGLSCGAERLGLLFVELGVPDLGFLVQDFGLKVCRLECRLGVCFDVALKQGDMVR